MVWPIDDLSLSNLDADSDTVTGVSGARAQLYDLGLKVQAVLAENPALKDEANIFTARQDFNLSGETARLIAAASAGVRMGLYADNGSPTTESGRLGYIGAAVDLIIENLVSNGDVNIKTAGSGELQHNGIKVATLDDRAWVPIDSSTFTTAQSTLNFPDIFTTAYDHYIFDFLSASPETDNRFFSTRLATSGSSWLTGSTDYADRFVTLVSDSGDAKRSLIYLSGNVNGISSDVSDLHSEFTVHVKNPMVSGKRTTIQSVGSWVETTVNALVDARCFGYVNRTAEQHASIQFGFATGTTLGGGSNGIANVEVQVYGVTKG